MIRLLRPVFTCAAVVSALLFLATCALWARSYWRGVYLTRNQLHYGTSSPYQTRDSHSAYVARGGLLLQWQHVEINRPATGTGPAQGTDWGSFVAKGYPYPYDNPIRSLSRPAESRIRLLGFEFVRPHAASPAQTSGNVWMAMHSCTIPLPAISALLSIAPLWWLAGHRKARRAHRAAAGLCPNCGYDLRATPEQGRNLLDRCPECGTASSTEGHSA